MKNTMLLRLVMFLAAEITYLIQLSKIIKSSPKFAASLFDEVFNFVSVINWVAVIGLAIVVWPVTGRVVAFLSDGSRK
jgi:hypothetical protein